MCLTPFLDVTLTHTPRDTRVHTEDRKYTVCLCAKHTCICKEARINVYSSELIESVKCICYALKACLLQSNKENIYTHKQMETHTNTDACTHARYTHTQLKSEV